MINRYKLVFVSVILSDQDVTAVTVQVQNPEVQNRNLVHLISTKKVRGVILDGPAAFDKALQRSDSLNNSLFFKFDGSCLAQHK